MNRVYDYERVAQLRVKEAVPLACQPWIWQEDQNTAIYCTAVRNTEPQTKTSRAGRI